MLIEINNNKRFINLRDSDGNTPLHYTVMYNKLDQAKILLEYGATYIPNGNGDTPLHIVTSSKSEDLDQTLFNLIIKSATPNGLNLFNRDSSFYVNEQSFG